LYGAGRKLWMDNQYVVVLGRNYTSRLGMIRAAGQAGCKVAVLRTDRHDDNIDRFSKYVVQYFQVPQPDAEGIIQLLLREFGGREKKVVLLPTDDYTASVIDQNQERLRDAFFYPNIGHEPGKVVHYMDKGIQKEMARKAGLDVAKGWTARWHDGKYVVPEKVDFPCFIKPELSIRGTKQSMRKCASGKELEETLGAIKGDEGAPVLIEQFIEIEKEYDIPGLALGETVILPGIIEKGEIFLGVTATGTMRPMEKYGGLGERLKQFIRQFHFWGLIDIELLESKGTIYFNELNLRFGASGFAMTGIGVNLPELLIKAFVDGEYGESLEAKNIDVKVEEYTFASEKVMMQKFAFRQLSHAEYKKILGNADFAFVRQETDPRPYREFRKMERWLAFKMCIKRLLGRR